MKSAFDLKTGTWNIPWPERISRHDVVYQTPPDDPLHGLPLGNGEFGALCWFEGSRLYIVLNKSDLWDDAAFTRFHCWDQIKEEERSTTLRHGGRLIIDFHAPIFDLFYLFDCQGRLSLADGSMTMRVSGPFGTVTIHAFVEMASGVLCCRIESDLHEDVPIEITLERYGSRMGHHWYSVHRSGRDWLNTALKGTSSHADAPDMYVRHPLTSGTFAIGCRAVVADPLTAECRNPGAYYTQCMITGQRHKDITLYVAATSPLADDPMTEAKRQLDQAEKLGYDALFARHSGAWKNFWLRSLLDTGHDFIDGVWHLLMYYARSSQGGRYPGRFIGGLWNHARDFQAWGFYFHWNQQQVYWPLNAAGHHDLVEPYLRWRFDALPHAKQDAKEILGAAGAAVADVVERRGYNSIPELNNHTPVAQIAMEFWRQYQFTGDDAFLRQYALPYMLEAAAYFETLFVRDENGVYHGNKGCGYEGLAQIRDCITELASAAVLFPAVLDALRIAGVDDPRASKWRDLCDHLAPFMMVQPGDQMIKRENATWRYTRGLFTGDAATCDRILAVGYVLEEEGVHPSLIPYNPDKIATGIDIRKLIFHDQPLFRTDAFLRRMVKGENPYVPSAPHVHVFGTIFPFAEYAAVFPSGALGLSHNQSLPFKAAVNSAKLYAGYMNGWDPVMIVMARLGLSREAYYMMDRAADQATIYPNGLFAELPAEYIGIDAPFKLRCMDVDDWDLPAGERRMFVPSKPFRRIGMEAPSSLSTALNETLLQSYDGVLRVAPAADMAKPARFTLHAVGGFVVSSETENGKPQWIHIESRLGKTARIANPWEQAFLFRNGKLERSSTDKIIECSTQPDERIMLVPDPAVLTNWQHEPLECHTADQPRWSPAEANILGLPRMF